MIRLLESNDVYIFGEKAHVFSLLLLEIVSRNRNKAPLSLKMMVMGGSSLVHS